MLDVKIMIAVLALTLFAPFNAHAAEDDFGARFSGTAPAALVDESAPDSALVAQDGQAQELQNIAPAAGAEAPVADAITEQEVPAAQDEDMGTIPPKAPASTHDGYERDLENQTH